MNENVILNQLEERFAAVQKSLLNDITKEYLLGLEVENDVVKFSERNLQATAEVERIIQKFTNKTTPIFKWYAKRLIDVTGATSASYLPQATVDQMEAAKTQIQGIYDRIGIDDKGNIIKGGFLSRLSNLDTLRQDITNHLSKEIAVGRSYGELMKGFAAFIYGNSNVNGAMLRYVRTELHDLTMRFSQSVENQYARTLQLQYFIYQGTEMDTTRDFCRERFGKCFHVSDVENWSKDLPYFPPNYNFFEDRGGYNCRHKIAWVSNELGKRLRTTIKLT